MLISYSHKFIFFHVAKVAGLSIRAALKPYAQEPERFKIKRPPRHSGEKPNPFYEIWEAILLHTKASDAKKELPEMIYDSFFKFAFVRNPWDWQVSMYHFILKSLFKISIKGCSARQNWSKKRSIHVVCEHFEASFNAAMRPSARS